MQAVSLAYVVSAQGESSLWSRSLSSMRGLLLDVTIGYLTEAWENNEI